MKTSFSNTIRILQKRHELLLSQRNIPLEEVPGGIVIRYKNRL